VASHMSVEGRRLMLRREQSLSGSITSSQLVTGQESATRILRVGNPKNVFLFKHRRARSGSQTVRLLPQVKTIYSLYSGIGE